MKNSRDLAQTRSSWMERLPKALLSRLRALCTNNSGATAVAAAILFPVLIGGMGLGAEVGYWYMTQRKLQHAADIAAHSAAVRMNAGDEKSAIETVALHIARGSGLSATSGVLAVNIPPLSGDLSGNARAVEIVLSQDIPRLLSSILGAGSLNIEARAVAKLNSGCVLALSPNAPAAVDVSGSFDVTLNGCDVASNSKAPNALHIKSGGD